MKKISVLILIILFAFTSLALAEKGVRVPFQPTPDKVQYVPNEFVVKFQSDVGKISPRMVNGIAQIGKPKFDVLNRTFKVDKMEAEFPGFKAQPGVPDLSGYYVLRFNGSFKLEKALDAYSRLPFVHHVEPIGIHSIYGVPDDPYFDDPPESFPYYQWHFEQATADHDVDATAAWDLETRDVSVLMGIIDTGVRYYHRDLGGYLAPDDVTQGNMWINYGEYGSGKESNGVDDDGNGYVDDWIGWDWVDGVRPCHRTEDCSEEDNDPRDHNGHGTHVAGIVGAITNNTYCGAGMAGGWNASRYEPSNGAKLMALRIGWTDNRGLGWVRMDFAAQAMYYAANMGAIAVNCSWGSSESGGLPEAMDYAIAKGVLVVAAAGNSNSETPDYLGTRTDVMNVAATDSFDVKAYFSNYGTWVDVSAPGVDVLSTYHSYDDPEYDYIALISGTSQACPHVVGLAGLLKSYEPTLTSSDLWYYIENYADPIDHLNPGYEGKLGSGRINAYNSLNVVGPPCDVVADFSGDPTSGCAPLTVNFTDLSSGPVISWSWDFGNGGTSTAQNPSHEYTSAGTYTVNLTVTSEICSDTETKTDYITVSTSPVADFAGDPTSGYAPLTVSFTDLSTNSPTSWSWDFGDGGTSTEQNPTHTYDTAGTYTVSLTASNACGSDIETKADYVTVTEAPPEAPMFVESISMRLKTAGPNVTAYATPKVVEDVAGYPALEGVTVYGHWYGATSDVDECITGSDGTCEVASDRVRNPSQDFCFQVDSLKKTNYYWDDTKGVTYNCITPGAGKHTGPPFEFSTQNYPNPFNPTTEFFISLPQDTHVSFVIYNVMGQKVKTLVDDYMSAGTHTIRWDGTNEYGSAVSSGIYFYRVVAGDNVVTKKMMLVK